MSDNTDLRDLILGGKSIAAGACPDVDASEQGRWVRVVLLIALFAVIVLTLFAAFAPGWLNNNLVSGMASSPVDTDQRLLTEDPLDVPIGLPSSWLVLLIALFAVLQIAALLGAWSKAHEYPLREANLRTVAFLCEVPMYLGLLGSLVGVSLTQFVTGSLAAPLAYLTTITGILLHLFGKYTIWLPLPVNGESFDSDD